MSKKISIKRIGEGLFVALSNRFIIIHFVERQMKNFLQKVIEYVIIGCIVVIYLVTYPIHRGDPDF